MDKDTCCYDPCLLSVIIWWCRTPTNDIHNLCQDSDNFSQNYARESFLRNPINYTIKSIQKSNKLCPWILPRIVLLSSLKYIEELIACDWKVSCIGFWLINKKLRVFSPSKFKGFIKFEDLGLLPCSNHCVIWVMRSYIA